MDKEQIKLEDLIKRATRSVPKEAVLSMSGGIDSGLLGALIRPERVVTVHLPFGEKYDEFSSFEKTFKWLGLKEKIIIELDISQLDKVMPKAVKAIGRQTPHFNIFPLYCMYEKLASMGVKYVVLGDGPDETMCGYSRHLIMNYLYGIKDLEAFENYGTLIGKIISNPIKKYAEIIGKDEEEVRKLMEGQTLINGMCRVDMELMRPDMDDMSNNLAKYFGIINLRPYQDNKEIDDFMFNLPSHSKIKGEFGKYLLRKLAFKYLPPDIAWRQNKMGGPVFPINKFKGWDKTDGEFGKESYLKYQQEILNA